MLKDFLIDDNLNKEIEVVGLVKSCELLTSSTDQKYLNITLADKSAHLNCKRWGTNDVEYANCKVGEIFVFKGTLVRYKNNYQLKVSTFSKAPAEMIQTENFFVKSRTPIEMMVDEMNSLIDQIKDEEIKALVRTCVDENFDRFTTYPAAATVHHSYLHGLLFHSLSVTRNALNIASNYSYFKHINKDYLICGALLHDLGKTRELSGPSNTVYTIEGNLIGHISIGFNMIMEVGHRLNVTPEKLNVIGNIILSHHGKLEFGSPITAATLEAFIIHYADEIDSKMEILYEPYQTGNPGSTTDKISFMDRNNYYIPVSYDKEEKE